MIFHIAWAAVLASIPTKPLANLPPKMLILGSPHLANHNRDITNIHVGDIQATRRQREIEAIVAKLASFRPTRVAVEWPADEQARLDQRYADYLAGRYALSADEVDQIGLRLAAKLKLPRVDAVNWNDEPPGADNDYDFPAWAKAHGQDAEWQAFVGAGQREAGAESELMKCTPISSWYRRLNSPRYRASNQRRYYRNCPIRRSVSQSGRSLGRRLVRPKSAYFEQSSRHSRPYGSRASTLWRRARLSFGSAGA